MLLLSLLIHRLHVPHSFHAKFGKGSINILPWTLLTDSLPYQNLGYINPVIHSKLSLVLPWAKATLVWVCMFMHSGLALATNVRETNWAVFNIAQSPCKSSVCDGQRNQQSNFQSRISGGSGIDGFQKHFTIRQMVATLVFHCTATMYPFFCVITICHTFWQVYFILFIPL